MRHAKAGSRGDWDGDDAFRPLSRAGRVQADALVPLLSPFGPDRILSSPMTRCVQTVEPLAAACDLKVEDEPSIAEGHTQLALTLMRQMLEHEPERAVVCCTHGDIVPEILRELVEADGVRIGREPRWQKGSIWVLHTDDGRFTGADYIPPPR